MAAVGVSALLPFVSSSDYVIRVAVNTVLFALLALGLNVVVGWAGLLDLGFVAFYGFGAYMLRAALVAAVRPPFPGAALGLDRDRLLGAARAAAGAAVAAAGRRLPRDRDPLLRPDLRRAGDERRPDHTSRGTTARPTSPADPNGITDIDPISIFGYEFGSTRSYLWLSLGVFAVVVVALQFINHSRTGRAWRALREDSLAAEMMSMPVNRLKLLAFMFGAATAGLTGTIFASVQLGVFPQNFDLPLLITVYAMVILGGAGSIPGVVIGAITINVSLELLREPGNARFLFYVAIGLGLVTLVRPWRKLAAILVGMVVFGIVAYQLAEWLRPAWVSGTIEGGRFAGLLDGWVIHPVDSAHLGNAGFVLLIVALLALTELRGVWRSILLVPTLYLAAFVWENRLVVEPSVTRILLLGALLVVLMSWRPQGLLGTSRVEIV